MTLQLVTSTKATLFRNKKVTSIENESLTNCQLGELDLGGTNYSRIQLHPPIVPMSTHFHQPRGMPENVVTRFRYFL